MKSMLRTRFVRCWKHLLRCNATAPDRVPPAPRAPDRERVTEEESRWLQGVLNNHRYTAFVDVLGYRTLLADPAITPESRRVEYLYDAWQTLLQAFNRMLSLSPDVEAILFSDSVYLGASNPRALLTSVALLYMDVFAFLRGHPEKWLPWLRAGVAEGWVMSIHDPSAAMLASETATRGGKIFRNPAGPPILHAVSLSELKTAPGVRILLPRSIFHTLVDVSAGALPNATVSLIADRLIADPQPLSVCALAGQDIVDLPWWRIADDEPSDRLALWREHEWQRGFGNAARAVMHYEATVDLLSRE